MFFSQYLCFFLQIFIWTLIFPICIVIILQKQSKNQNRFVERIATSLWMIQKQCPNFCHTNIQYHDGIWKKHIFSHIYLFSIRWIFRKTKHFACSFYTETFLILENISCGKRCYLKFFLNPTFTIHKIIPYGNITNGKFTNGIDVLQAIDPIFPYQDWFSCWNTITSFDILYTFDGSIL